MTKNLIKFFTVNWQRKLISLVLSVIIWFLVNNSLIIEQTYANVAVRITNIPKGMRVEGIQPDGFLQKRVALKIVGYKKVLEDLSTNDIQILFNAQDKEGDWVAIANKHQIVFLNKLTNPYPLINSVKHEPFVVTMAEGQETP